MSLQYPVLGIVKELLLLILLGVNFAFLFSSVSLVLHLLSFIYFTLEIMDMLHQDGQVAVNFSESFVLIVECFFISGNE